MSTVWIVFYGNYFPRELDSIWSTEELAKARAATDRDLDFEAWEVGCAAAGED